MSNTLGASLLENLLPGKGARAVSQGVTATSWGLGWVQGVIRADKGAATTSQGWGTVWEEQNF